MRVPDDLDVWHYLSGACPKIDTGSTRRPLFYFKYPEDDYRFDMMSMVAGKGLLMSELFGTTEGPYAP